MKAQLVLRARILCGVFIAAGLLLTARLYFVQIVHGADYQKQAMGQYVEPSPDTEARGDIYFTTKDGALVSAAVMQSGWRIAINPEDIGDANALYTKLNGITPIYKERYMASAAKKTDPYEEIAFRVNDDAAQKIRAMKLTGVILVQDQWRSYPGGELAAQVVGFTGYKGNSPSRVGVYGLERQWEATLQETTSGLYVNPFAEIFTNVQAALSQDPAGQQGDIITTIDPAVQAQLEKTLDGVMKTYTPRLAAASPGTRCR